jgi:hypothetical protein
LKFRNRYWSINKKRAPLITNVKNRAPKKNNRNLADVFDRPEIPGLGYMALKLGMAVIITGLAGDNDFKKHLLNGL